MLEPDPELLTKASELAARLIEGKYGQIKKNLFWDENSRYGILIIHANTTEKYNGISALAESLAPEETVMIGDSFSDFLDLPNVTQYAVRNADLCYKEKAKFVAKHSLTQGVIDCLQQISKNI